MNVQRAVLFFLVLVFGWWIPAEAAPVNTLVISEVFYDREGTDDGYEWIELFNGTSASIDLSEWSLGWGGGDYTDGTLQLSGIIQPAEYFVLGGTGQDPTNGSPVYDLPVNIRPDLQNSGTTADGISLFNLLASSITATSRPFFSVIYGSENTNNLIDHTGAIGTVDVGDAPAGQSIEYLGNPDGWTVASTPNPGTGSLSTVPIPSAVWLFCSGLFFLLRAHRK